MALSAFPFASRAVRLLHRSLKKPSRNGFIAHTRPVPSKKEFGIRSSENWLVLRVIQLAQNSRKASSSPRRGNLNPSLAILAYLKAGFTKSQHCHSCSLSRRGIGIQHIWKTVGGNATKGLFIPALQKQNKQPVKRQFHVWNGAQDVRHLVAINVVILVLDAPSLPV